MKVKYKGFEFEATCRAVREWRKQPVQFDPNTRNRIPRKTRQRVYKRDGYKCVQCGEKDNLSIDHIIPLSQGGPDRETNMHTLCIVCNQRKGNKIITNHIRI